MKNLRTKLPPVSSLVTFEAAARLANFTRAASELGVTQAAVSKQIHSLEEFLGIKLFARANRGIAVTPQGRRLLHAVVSGLDHIATIVDELRRPTGPAQVSITTTIALASVWLMPRVAAFRAIHPEIDLRIIAADPIMDLAAEGIDLGIRYGMGQWPGITAQPLFHIDLFPVCSPSYLERHPRPRNPHDLLSATLLHIDEPNSQDADWAVWFAAMGMVTPPFTGGLHFNNYPLLIQAALNGQGIGLGWGHIVDDLIKSGALVRPIDSMRRLKPAFYLAVPTDIPVRESAQIFHDWLLADTAPLRATESRRAPRLVPA